MYQDLIIDAENLHHCGKWKHPKALRQNLHKIVSYRELMSVESVNTIHPAQNCEHSEEPPTKLPPDASTMHQDTNDMIHFLSSILRLKLKARVVLYEYISL